MLKPCPECGLNVSDKAEFCPHCGLPLTKTPRRTYKKRPHKRLPNGFGQISKINKPLRKPYRAMVTIGKTETGRPIVKPLKPEAYFATYNEAYEALVKYNTGQTPAISITVADLYAAWSKDYFQTVTPYTVRHYEMLYRRIEAMHSKNITDITALQVRSLMDEAPLSLKERIYYLFAQLFDYAVEYGYIDKNIIRAMRIPRAVAKDMKASKIDHIAFSDEEMAILWSHEDDQIVQAILIQCYTGFRPQELLNITPESVNLTENTIKGGLKTEAGKDRIVPIHPKIRHLVEKRVKDAKTTLFGMAYQTYYKKFKETCRKYKLDTRHRPHDPRKHFVTMAKAADVNDYAIKRIVGHAISDITEKTYTERPISWLQEEIRKIPV